MSWPLDGVYSANDSANRADQSVVPTTGQNVVMTDNDKDGILYLNPAGLLAALTVTLPSNANSKIGEERLIASSKAVTLLTVVNPSGGTVIAPASLALGANIAMRKVADNTWMQVTT
jgi:hypothetical protein